MAVVALVPLRADVTTDGGTTAPVNPRLLSSGRFLAREPAIRHVPPAPVRSGPADLSKGKPPAVLDARVGPNVHLGADPSLLVDGQTAQAEPHIARSLTNPDLLLATFQEGRYAVAGGAINNGYAISRDGGFSWQRALIPQLTQSTGGIYRRATDPVAAIGPQGDLYLNSLVSTDDAFTSADLVLTRSTDNGATWSSPLTIFRQTTPQAAPDKNWLVVNDLPGTSSFGRLACSWTNFTTDVRGNSTGNNIVVAVSDDRGATWTAPLAVTPTGTINQGSLPLFLPDGSLLVVFLTINTPSNPTLFSVQCKRSIDGGRTFPAVATTIAASVSGWDDPDLRNGMLVPQAAVARQSGVVVVTYNAVVAGTPRVLVVRSADQGTTWSAPAVASDNPDGVSVTNPAVAITPDGATVTVLFTDKRLSPVAPDGHRYFVDHYAALSFDGGATWQPGMRLSEMSSDVRYAPLTSQGYMLGDYLGLAPSPASDQPCVAIWCDTRRGDADPFVVRLAGASSSTLDAWRIAYFNRTELADPTNTKASNLPAFLTGANPRVKRDGEVVVFNRTADDRVNAAAAFVAARANAIIPAARLVFYSGDVSDAGSGPVMTFNLNGQRPMVGELPPTPLRTGFVWSATAFSVPPTRAAAVLLRMQVDFSGSFGGPVLSEPPDTFPLGAAVSVDTAVNATDSRLVNLSTRGFAGSGASQLIVGFVIDGNKTMLLRAAGPALASFGVAGALTDPRLNLAAPAANLSLANDNWQQGSATATLFARLGAFPFSAGSLDAALVTSLGAQSYTAIVSGTASATGLTLVEAYDADAVPGASPNPRLVNLSTRGDVGTGDRALIAGFTLSGIQPRRVLIRAIGPSLATLGVTGVLADPRLELFRGTERMAINDDWEISRSSAAIAATAQRVGAFALNPASLDAALLITLAPGSYTVIVSGVDGATGIALVEIYDAD